MSILCGPLRALLRLINRELFLSFVRALPTASASSWCGLEISMLHYTHRLRLESITYILAQPSLVCLAVRDIHLMQC